MVNARKWVVSLYTLQAIPFALVSITSLILYKNLNFANTAITFITSLYTLPYFLKPILAPLLESMPSKRFSILFMSLINAGLCLLLALALTSSNFFNISVVLFFTISLASAIYDINADGLYIIALSKKEQAYFIGIRTICYRFGELICESGVSILASLFFLELGVKMGWQIAFIALAVLILLITLYHAITLPKIEKEIATLSINQIFKEIYNEIFRFSNLTLSISFIFIYQFTEYQLTKILPLYLLDPQGLHLTTAQVGFLIGAVGMLSMLIGILLSGIVLERMSLKSVFLPITFFAAITNVSYIFLTLYHIKNLYLIGMIIVIAKFGFGLSNGVYLLYLLRSFGRGVYAMSLYAMGTSLMILSMAIGGASSGYIQYLLGYQGFFIWIIFLSFIIILFSTYVNNKDSIINEN